MDRSPTVFGERWRRAIALGPAAFAAAVVAAPTLAHANDAALCATPDENCASRVTYDCAAAFFGVDAPGPDHGLGRPGFLNEATCVEQLGQFRGCIGVVGERCPSAAAGYGDERQRFLNGETGVSAFGASILAWVSEEPSFLRAFADRIADAESRAAALAEADEIDARRRAAASANAAIETVDVDGRGWADGAPFGHWRCELDGLGPVLVLFDRDNPADPPGDRGFGLSAQRTLDVAPVSASGALDDRLEASIDLDGTDPTAPTGFRASFPQLWADWPDGRTTGCVLRF